MSGALLLVPVLGVLLLLLGLGVRVAVALLATGALAMALGSNAPIGPILATTVWGHSNSWALAALPLFILMGELLLRARLADDLFAGLSPWLGRVPGRLLHVNVVGCAMFAAVSGSSAATAATIGRLSIPELERRGYPESLVLGTLAGSATLGLLIPPSIILIVYGVATEQSIARLFVAGVLPGLLLAAFFAGYVVLASSLRPGAMPEPEPRASFGRKLRASVRLVPVLALIAGVVGSIYAGVASPTDAAAVGVVLSLALAAFRGTLGARMFVDAVLGATVTSAMIAFILAGAAFLSVAMGFTGLPRELAAWIGTLSLSSGRLLLILAVFFVVLGCFLDGISLIVLTTSIVMPVIEAAGIDPLWFGIFLVIVVEMSQITPPVGFNLFVIQGLTGRDILTVARAALPFFALMALALWTITVFPSIVTVLPGLMSAGGG